MLDAALRERLAASYAAFFEGDLDGAVALMADDVLGVDAPEMPDAGELHGREQVKARLAGFWELFEQLRMRDLTIDELDGRVLIVIQVQGRSPATGLDVDFELAYVLSMDGEVITEIHSFLTEAQAREFAAAGA